jgi:hypothetical protein
MVGLGKGGLGKARLDYGSLIWSILNIIPKHDLNKISTIKVFYITKPIFGTFILPYL